MDYFRCWEFWSSGERDGSQGVLLGPSIIVGFESPNLSHFTNPEGG